jgi:hypothetical protein
MMVGLGMMKSRFGADWDKSGEMKLFIDGEEIAHGGSWEVEAEEPEETKEFESLDWAHSFSGEMKIIEYREPLPFCRLRVMYDPRKHPKLARHIGNRTFHGWNYHKWS